MDDGRRYSTRCHEYAVWSGRCIGWGWYLCDIERQNFDNVFWYNAVDVVCTWVCKGWYTSATTSWGSLIRMRFPGFDGNILLDKIRKTFQVIAWKAFSSIWLRVVVSCGWYGFSFQWRVQFEDFFIDWTRTTVSCFQSWQASFTLALARHASWREQQRRNAFVQ